MLSSPAMAQAAGSAPGGTESMLIQIVPLALLFVIFWFLVIRPQQKKMKAHRDMVESVQKGDQVVTGGGLMGRVTRVSDQEVEVELAPGLKVTAVKATLSGVTPRNRPAAANDGKS